MKLWTVWKGAFTGRSPWRRVGWKPHRKGERSGLKHCRCSPLFKQQLIAELLPPLSERRAGSSLNESEHMRELLELHTGFAQFRVVLPDVVMFSPGASRLRGENRFEVSLRDAVKAYVGADRTRLVKVMTAAVEQRKGYHFTGLRMVDGKPRVIETIADVKIEGDRVIEIVGYSRDISERLEKEALAISRARLIRHMVEDMPVPVVVLDRGLQVVACSTAWVLSHGLTRRAEALGKPLNKLIEVSHEITAAIIQAMRGKTAQFVSAGYAAEDGRPVKRSVVVTSWQCGSDATGGVLMMTGEERPPYATLEVADRALGRRTRSLIEMLETA